MPLNDSQKKLVGELVDALLEGTAEKMEKHQPTPVEPVKPKIQPTSGPVSLLCKYCKSPIEDDSLFCAKCGKRCDSPQIAEPAVPTSTDKSALESKKFVGLLLSTGSTIALAALSPIAANYGIPPDLITTAIHAVLGLGAVYFAGQSAVDTMAATKPKE